MYEFKMPSLGAEMEFGKLLEWKIKVGEKIKKHDIIAVVDTDKAAIEIESYQEGVVQKLIASPGDKIPVGGLLALIQTTGSEISETIPLQPSAPAEHMGMTKAIAAAMTRSKKEIPHYYLSFEIDVKKSLTWIEKFNERKPIPDRIVMAALLLKATALAAKEHREFNGFFINDEYKPATEVNVANVISLRQGGLLAPAICNIDQMQLPEVMKNLADIVTRARNGTLKSSEVSNGTITVTNLGEFGVNSVFGVIYPPQVSLVGFGKITAHKTLSATLSADHRVTDGHRGSHFLNAIALHLENPERL